MLFRKIPTLLLAAFALLAMASCKKSNTQGRYIPADASLIVHVNGASLNQKLPWDNVKQNELFKLMYADTSLSSIAKSALDNPENTGVDTKNDLLFFMVNDSAGSYVAFEGTIKDAAKFKAYNTASVKNATASQKDGVDYLSNNEVTVSWKENRFIIVADAPERKISYPKNPWMDSAFKQLNIDTTQKLVSTVARNGVQTASLLHSLTEDNSLGKNERFGKLVSDKADMHFYVNIEGMSKMNAGMPGMPGMNMINFSKLTEGAVATGSANFADGKIDVDMMFYAGKEMTNLWKKYGGTKINDDLLKRLPAKNIAIFMAMNFQPEGLKEFAKITGLEGLVSLGAPMFGFTLDDFIKANKGDLIFSVSNLTSDSSGKSIANIFFATSVKDKPSFDKLVAAGKKFGSEVSGKINSPLFFNYNEQYFSIGNNQASVDQFATKPTGNTVDLYKKIVEGPIAGYVNLQYIINSAQGSSSKDSLSQAAINASAKMWDNIMISGGNFKNDGLSQHVEINLLDKSTNSLKQLNTYMGIMGSLASQKKEQQKAGDITELRLTGTTSPGNDSTALVE